MRNTLNSHFLDNKSPGKYTCFTVIDVVVIDFSGCDDEQVSIQTWI